jgi:hypothetical protein
VTNRGEKRDMAHAQPCQSEIRELTPTEWFDIFDRASKRLLGISGADFIAKWEKGEFGPDPDDRPGVMEVAGLMPSRATA